MKFQLTSDNKFLKVIEATALELDQLKASFTKKIDGYAFHPMVQKGLWDGKVSFVHNGIYVPVGLWNEVLKMGQRTLIPTEIFGLDRIKNYIDREEFDKFFKDFFEGAEFQPYEYQLKAAYNIMVWGFSTSEIATSAGKTFLTFMTFLWMREKMNIKKVLMVVPNTPLVTQCLSDFTSYNNINKFIYYAKGISKGSKESTEGCHFVVGNFQTIVKRDAAFFAQFDAIIIDEAHGTKSASIKSILSKCINCVVKYGLSGTLLKEQTVEDYTIQSYLGPRIQKISPDFLISNGYATPIYIKSIWLDYLSLEEREKLASIRINKELSGSEMYNLERKVIIESEKRFNFIVDMISRVTKNSLVLFSNIKDDYGKRIYDALRAVTNKECYYVDGGTSTDTRTYYQKKMEEGDDKIMVASFATTSTGISIKNIHSIFFVESYKSEIIVKQSIGRGMRLYKGKEFVNVIDFVDDFSTSKSKKGKGIIAKHGEERLRIYDKEGFPTKIIKVQL